MKVVIVIDSLATGGAEKSMVDFASYLKDQNQNVTFVCFERREISRESDVVSLGLTVIYLKQKSFIKRGFELKKIINKLKPDIIHSVLVQSNILVRFLRLLTRQGKVVQSLVNTPYSKERKKDSKLPWRKFMLAKQIDKWTARLIPTFYHAITETVLHHYKPIYLIKDNYQVVYRGRTSNQFLNENNDPEFDLINVGRQEFAKGQITILKALVYLEQKYNIRNISLKILGFEGKSTVELVEYIRNHNIEDRVNILGYVTDVEKHLANASIFIFPSYYEGLGGALIEAFAARLPVVCSSLPVLKEVVGHPDAALFCSPGDHVCFAEKILELYQNCDRQKKLGNISYDRFESTFQLEKINKEMLGMYGRILRN